MQTVLEHVFVNMPWGHLHRYLDLVLDLRINVEIGFSAEDLDTVSLDEIAVKVDRIRRRGCRITAHGPFWDLCPGSVDARIRGVSRSRLTRLLEVAELVRPAQIVCHTGFDPRHHRGHRKVWIENSLGVWEPLIRRAEELNMLLLVENVWEETPEVHLSLFEKLRSQWFGFCLDTGHQNAFSKTALNVWLEMTGPFLKEIHVHDNDGSFDHHQPIGTGNIDFNLLFGFLKERGLSPVVTLEPHTEENLYRTVAALAELDCFRNFIEKSD